jgi:HEAT repeat protein
MRVCAAEALGMIGPAARDAVPSLIGAIDHPDADPDAEILTHYAVQALGRIGPDARAAVPILNRLFDKSVGACDELVIAMDGIGAPPVRKLAERLVQDNESSAADLLAWLGPKARDAVPALRPALADNRMQVRFSGAVALAHIQPGAAEPIPVLIEALSHLDDRDLDVANVPDALAQLGPAAQAALPKLVALVKKGTQWSDVLEALVRIDPGGQQSAPVLILALLNEDPEIVSTAARCLGLLGPRAREAVPALTAVMSRKFHKIEGTDELDDPQVNAVKAIGRMGPEARKAIPALIAALKSEYPTAVAAASVLGSFGPEAKVAVPALMAAVQANEKNYDNWFVVEAAALALARIGPDAKPAVPALRRFLADLPKGGEGMPEVVIALHRLAPDGPQIAQAWLNKRFRSGPGVSIHRQLERRALVLAAMGRSSLEGDVITRFRLNGMNSILAYPDPREAQVDIKYLESWMETFGALGVAARLAIPRLQELRKHANPWVRMWAKEALERIQPSA